MRSRRYTNLFPHDTHGLKEVLRWKFFQNNRKESEPFRIESIAESASGNIHGDRITWIGHSSFALFIADKGILVDPVFSDYCAPFRLQRFRRTAPPAVHPNALNCNAVLITHNHYDHLDRSTILRLNADTLYFVPAGLGGWFRRLGRRNVREFEWWESAEWDGMRITAIPAQHFSSRTLWDRDRTLWCGWVVEAAGRRIYFVGDSGYCPVFQEIGKRFGPFDLAAIPIGAYEPRWFMKPMHVNPEEAVQIHRDVNAKKSVACHWGTFRLTDEPMGEPPERLREALRASGLSTNNFMILKIGESVFLNSLR